MNILVGDYFRFWKRPFLGLRTKSGCGLLFCLLFSPEGGAVKEPIERFLVLEMRFISERPGKLKKRIMWRIIIVMPCFKPYRGGAYILQGMLFRAKQLISAML